MSRFLKSLSSLVNGNADRSSKRGAHEPDADSSTLTTPLFPVSGSDADPPGTSQQPPPGTLVPLATHPASRKVARKPASSRALNVRTTTQVALSTHVEPTAPPKVARAGHRSSVLLTETEKLRLQIMQVQLKLTGLGLYDGTIDGTMSPDLVDGVRHFQTLKGMRDSGLLTTGTLTALGIRALD
jgi:hypothetical protein